MLPAKMIRGNTPFFTPCIEFFPAKVHVLHARLLSVLIVPFLKKKTPQEKRLKIEKWLLIKITYSNYTNKSADLKGIFYLI